LIGSTLQNVLHGVVQPVVQNGPPAAPVDPPPAPGGYGTFLLETLLILAGVCVLAWAVIRFGLRRLYAAPQAPGGGPLRVIARLPLEPRRTVYIIEAGGKTLLVGAAESGPLAVLAELDAVQVAAAVRAAPRARSFLDVLNLKTREPAGSGTDGSPGHQP
jgi:flagellar biogenesis protein FliO